MRWACSSGSSSDPAWSDEDCLWPSAGAVQIDNIAVTMTQGEDSLTDLTDFETGLGNMEARARPGGGRLHPDLDRAATTWILRRQNLSPQVAFIDDGLVVPGVGPTMCVDWCYGPYGYVVNHTGGAWANRVTPGSCA